MPLPIRQSFIPAANANRPGVVVETFGTRPGVLLNDAPLYITVHETGNTRPGANAEMHRVFTHQGGGPGNVSFHFVVDDAEAIQLLPLDEAAYHASDGMNDRARDLGGFQSVAIETCVNQDGDWTKTFANLSDLIARIVRGDDSIEYAGRRGDFAIERIAQHNTWADDRKNCPAKIRAQELWDDLLTDVRRRLAPTQPAPSEPQVDARGQPSDAYLRELFGTVRPYDPTGAISTEWRRWCTEHGCWPPLVQVKPVTTASDRPSFVYWFENNLAIVWDGYKAFVLGTFKTTSDAAQAAAGG